jgi:hypothetical protein
VNRVWWAKVIFGGIRLGPRVHHRLCGIPALLPVRDALRHHLPPDQQMARGTLVRVSAREHDELRPHHRGQHQRLLEGVLLAQDMDGEPAGGVVRHDQQERSSPRGIPGETERIHQGAQPSRPRMDRGVAPGVVTSLVTKNFSERRKAEVRRIYLPRTWVNNVGVSTVKLLWFFLWRMTLAGLLFGVGLGAAYGMTVLPSIFLFTGILGSGPGTNAEPVDGALFSMLVGTPVGGVLGAVAGLTLGTLEGVLLFFLTLLRYRESPSETSRYQRVASFELCCGKPCELRSALGSLRLALRPPEQRALSSAELSEVLSRDLDDLLIVVIGPAPVAMGAAWFSRRLIAGQYVQRVSQVL